MRIVQIALVAAVVVVGLLGYTESGHRSQCNRLSQRLQAWLQLRQLGGLKSPQLAASFILAILVKWDRAFL
jgi:hypothetical protein